MKRLYSQLNFQFMKAFFKIIIILTILTFSYSCNQDEYLKVEQFQDSNNLKNGLKPPPPIKIDYTSLNIVVDSLYNIYFHFQKIHRIECGTGLELESKTNIRFIQKHEIICLNNLNLKTIFNNNKFECNKIKDQFYLVRIALMKDSIPYDKVNAIYDFIKQSDSIHFSTAYATDEEKVVIYHKRNNLDYNTDEYPWDTSKNIFHKREF